MSQIAINNRNRMSAVTRNGQAYATYIYNALEQLASRNTADPNGPVGTVHYIYDTDGHLIAEANAATGATTREYVWLPGNDNQNDTLAESTLPQLAGGGARRAEGVPPIFPWPSSKAPRSIRSTPITWAVQQE